MLTASMPELQNLLVKRLQLVIDSSDEFPLLTLDIYLTGEDKRPFLGDDGHPQEQQRIFKLLPIDREAKD